MKTMRTTAKPPCRKPKRDELPSPSACGGYGVENAALRERLKGSEKPKGGEGEPRAVSNAAAAVRRIGRGSRLLKALPAVLLSAVLLACGCDRAPLVADDLEEARAAAQERNWTLAERLLQRYLRSQQEPDKRWDAWQRLLEVTRSAGPDPRAALEYLEAMLMEFAEDDARAEIVLRRMGELNESLRRYDKAADAWSTYIELAGLDAEEAVEAHRRLARLHFRARRFEAGEDVLQSCLALPFPEAATARCLYDLADMHAAREQWEEVTGLALQILDLKTGDELQGRASFLLADALEQQNKLSEALRYFEAARNRYPNEMVVDNRIAYLKKKLKK